MELEAEQPAYARDMAEQAGLAKWIDYRVGDALQLLAGEAGPFDFW
jgi:predicted O-methyltransferase YrrM